MMLTDEFQRHSLSSTETPCLLDTKELLLDVSPYSGPCDLGSLDLEQERGAVILLVHRNTL